MDETQWAEDPEDLWDPDDCAVPMSFRRLSAHEIASEAQITMAAANARLWASMADALADARRDPSEWVPMHPGQAAGARERDMAERAAALDLASGLRLPVATVRSQAELADRGRRRLPGLWHDFRHGVVTVAHVRAALDASNGLDEETVVSFDAHAVRIASAGLTASAYRIRVRNLAERLDRTALAVRREEAMERRGVWVEHVGDGMAWLTACLTSDQAAKAMAHLDGAAAHLASVQGETRTKDQLRADAAADLLSARGTPAEVRTSVHVSVPVLSVLGRSDAPALLDGVVPIDPETARELCRDAPSFIRILTDPVSSTVLDVDRRSYRPPADLARFVRIRDGVCTRCGSRRAAVCDLDHVVPHLVGGPTSAANLAALCCACHRLKHETLWRVVGEHGRTTWTAPTGRRYRTPPTMAEQLADVPATVDARRVAGSSPPDLPPPEEQEPPSGPENPPPF